jgi:hypothetical protein
MGTIFGDNLYAGLSGAELAVPQFDLGSGVRISKTYAHLMAPFLMAFQPAPKGGHHPAPWKPASGGFSFDGQAELFVPSELNEKYESTISVARTILFLLRVRINPAITLPVFSNYAFSALPQVGDGQTRLMPFEVQPRHFPLGIVGGTCTEESLRWVAERWKTTHRLSTSSAEFALAVDALDSGQFVQSTALALVSLWGALEALFSPSTSELKFRVSALIAAYLEPPGGARLQLQREVAKLYDKRSAAAHGKPKHTLEDLLATFQLLRRVLLAMIDADTVPTKANLEERLFGAAT